MRGVQDASLLALVALTLNAVAVAAVAGAPAADAGPVPSPGEAALLRAAPPPVHEGFDWHLPRGFPTPAVPADNPMSAAKVALGRRLFFDPRLSLTGRYSCASCHDPARAYTDGRKLAIGATGGRLDRNAMALVNVAYNISFGWKHPEVRSLEQQMRLPLFNQHPVELGLTGREPALLRALSDDPGYAREFQSVFGSPVSMPNLIKAIAAFERTLISGGSPFDRYVFGGESQALGPAAKRGMALFFSNRAGCGGCHSGFNFAGNWRDSQGETGPASFADNGTGAVVRVPTLRDVARTAPYMHDGRYATLDEVLAHYERVGARPDATGVRDRRLRAFTLTSGERADLKAFLVSLSGAPRVRRPRNGTIRVPSPGAATSAASAAGAAAP